MTNADPAAARPGPVSGPAREHCARRARCSFCPGGDALRGRRWRRRSSKRPRRRSHLAAFASKGPLRRRTRPPPARKARPRSHAPFMRQAAKGRSGEGLEAAILNPRRARSRGRGVAVRASRRTQTFAKTLIPRHGPSEGRASFDAPWRPSGKRSCVFLGPARAGEGFSRLWHYGSSGGKFALAEQLEYFSHGNGFTE